MKIRLVPAVLLVVLLTSGCGSDSTDPTPSSPFSVASVWAATRINNQPLPYDWVMLLLDGSGGVLDSLTIGFRAIEFRLGADLATCEVYQRLDVSNVGVSESQDSCSATYENGILDIAGFGSSGLTAPSGSALEGTIRGGGTTAASFTLLVPAYTDPNISQPALSIVFTKQ